MPFSAAQATGPVNQVPSGTSEKSDLVASALASTTRERTVTNIARVTSASGAKVVSLTPTMYPLSETKPTALSYQAPALTSENLLSALTGRTTIERTMAATSMIEMNFANFVFKIISPFF